MTGEIYTCERCGQPVEKDAADTVKAERIERTDDNLAGETSTYGGEGLLYHDRCWVGDGPRVRRIVD